MCYAEVEQSLFYPQPCPTCGDCSVVECDGCGDCQECCNCTDTDCDCTACEDRRATDEDFIGFGNND